MNELNLVNNEFLRQFEVQIDNQLARIEYSEQERKIFLTKVGIVDSQFLKDRRKYVVVIIFAAAALLTPPDPITQIGLAIPLLILYELSIFSVKFIENKNLRVVPTSPKIAGFVRRNRRYKELLPVGIKL